MHRKGFYTWNDEHGKFNKNNSIQYTHVSFIFRQLQFQYHFYQSSEKYLPKNIYIYS